MLYMYCIEQINHDMMILILTLELLGLDDITWTCSNET